MPKDIPTDGQEQHVIWLADQARKIIKDPEGLYDLAGRRLALVSVLLKDHFQDPANSFKYAIIGNPNHGKTTFAYSTFKIFQYYGVPSHYVDLDIYTESGRAMSQEIDWSQRRKRTLDQIAEDEIRQSISNFGNAGTGITIGDFPGKVDDPYQIDRLKKANLALILAGDEAERSQWTNLCTAAGVGRRWVFSVPEFDQIYGSDRILKTPAVTNMDRSVVINPLTIASATSMLIEAADITKAKGYDYQSFFSDPELVVLEEFLDFMVSIRHV